MVPHLWSLHWVCCLKEELKRRHPHSSALTHCLYSWYTGPEYTDEINGQPVWDSRRSKIYRLEQQKNHTKESQTVAIHCCGQLTPSSSGMIQFDFHRKNSVPNRPSSRGEKSMASTVHETLCLLMLYCCCVSTINVLYCGDQPFEQDLYSKSRSLRVSYSRLGAWWWLIQFPCAKFGLVFEVLCLGCWEWDTALE